jgi:DNA-binding transcriptional MerR regulator
MNKPKAVLNGFPAKEVHRITRLSVHMIDYLAREGYLHPAYEKRRIRGNVRYYSYRDLIVARIVRKLLNSGVELQRLKRAIQQLSEDQTWFPKDGRAFDLLVTDGKHIYYHDKSGSLVELTPGRQRSFAFVVDVEKTQDEVKRRLSKEKLKRYTIRNEPLLFVRKERNRKGAA